jgi:nucleotide-binding universal stress UspA family protein
LQGGRALLARAALLGSRLQLERLAEVAVGGGDANHPAPLKEARLYRKILVALDNSEPSAHAAAASVKLARAAGSTIVGAHVYAARLHYDRFRQMEPGLPERYQTEEKLAYEREIHEDLIGRGLRIISDSYLEAVRGACAEASVSFEGKALEGRNYEQLLEEAQSSGCDLIAMGAHGLGKTRRSVLGSVCERVARLATCDLLVARSPEAPGCGPVIVALDGSPCSAAALEAAVDLVGLQGGELSAIAAYDPFFHLSAFKSLEGVLSPETSKLFRFREQEKLHDEIIDKGLREVYQASLDVARERAEARGVALRTEVFEGKAYEAILDYAERARPALLVAGCTGIHHGSGIGLGSTAESLLRFAPCNVLLVSGEAVTLAARTRSSAGVPMSWTASAEERLAHIPSFVRAMVRRRVESLARERGLDHVDEKVLDDAKSRSGK